MIRRKEKTAAPKSVAEAGMHGHVMLTNAMKVIGRRSDGLCIVTNDLGKLLVIDDVGNVEAHELPYGALLHVVNGQKIKPGSVLAEWCPMTVPIIAEKKAIVVFSDIIEGQSAARQVDEITGLATIVIIDKPMPKFSKDQAKLAKLVRTPRPRIILESDDRMCQCTKQLASGTAIYVSNHDEVEPGEIIARVLRTAVEDDGSEDNDM